MKYDYLIVGAGFFGSVFAHEANKAGKKCLVIDKRNHIGGNAYTKETEGIPVHVYGPHIFHTSDREVWEYINQFAEFNGFINAPIARYKDEIYNLPFNMNTFSKMWGVKTPQEAKQEIEKQRQEANVVEPKNLEEQAINLVGMDIYLKLIKGYTQKQWGTEPENLPAFIIKRLPVRFTYNNNYFRDKYQGIPAEGYTKLIEKMLYGIEVKLDADFFEDKQYYENIADKIIFTGMIDEYYDYKLGVLEYRSLRFESKIEDTDNYQGNAVVNYTEAEIEYTRMIEHKHFYPDLETEKTVITKEYPQVWTKDLIPYYPINNERNNQLYKRYEAIADEETNVIFGGRLAQYKYYDMDKVIRAAMEMAKDELNISNS